MNSQFMQEASEACFNGCCSSPFSSHFDSQKQEEFEFSLITSGASFLTRDIKFTSQDSLPPLRTSFYDLITAFPDYLQTTQADHLRSTEYQNLSSSSRHVFGQQQPLFSYSQFQQQQPSLFTLSCKTVSSGKELLSFSSQETRFQSMMRKRIMGFMNLDESEYHMILTQDRCSAFKIVAELYSFKTNPNLLTVYNYEDEAVQELIRITEKKGIKPESAEFSWPSTEILSEKLRRKIVKTKKKRKEDKRGLFVFPLQSKVTGASYSYSWMSLAHEYKWHVLLDTSALGSKDMETLGLSLFRPDFVISSFTEVLGQEDDHPSGFGCLFVKKSSSQALTQEPKLITNPANLTVVKAEPNPVIENDEITLERGFKEEDHEDHKASTSATEIVEQEEEDKAMIEFRGLDHADSLGLILLSRRSKSLILWLVRALMSLQHPGSHQTEMPLIRIYGPKTTKQSRGPSVSFNIFDWQGEKVDPLMVEKLAEREEIGLRCVYLQKIRIGNKRRSDDEVRGQRQNLSLRVSVVSVGLGFMTSFDDVFRVWGFVSRFLDADFVEKEKWRKKALEKKTNDGVK